MSNSVWLDYNDPAATADSATDDDIIASTTAANNESRDSDDSDEETDSQQDIDGAPVEVPTAEDTVRHLEQAIVWFETTQIDSVN